jgi:DNA-binding PadR family transcriptional regulator
MTSAHASCRPPFDNFLSAAFRAMSPRGPGHHRGGPPRGRGRWSEFGFGPGGGGPPWGGPPWARGRKARRGDVRAAALVLLDEEPRNGYQLMQEIEDRSEGAWRPSPGSVYPALAQLEDEGLVRTVESEGRRVFELTDEGRAHVEEHRAELGAPWEAFSQDVSDESWELMGLMKDVGIAAMQVMSAGDEAQNEQARKILAEAKRALYRILADEEKTSA